MCLSVMENGTSANMQTISEAKQKLNCIDAFEPYISTAKDQQELKRRDCRMRNTPVSKIIEGGKQYEFERNSITKIYPSSLIGRLEEELEQTGAHSRNEARGAINYVMQVVMPLILAEKLKGVIGEYPKFPLTLHRDLASTLATAPFSLL